MTRKKEGPVPSFFYAQRPIPNTQLPIPNTQYPIPNAASDHCGEFWLLLIGSYGLAVFFETERCTSIGTIYKLNKFALGLVSNRPKMFRSPASSSRVSKKLVADGLRSKKSSVASISPFRAYRTHSINFLCALP